MNRKHQKNNGIWRKAFPERETIKFKDNRQRFRRFGNLKKELKWFSYSISSFISIVISIVPLVWKKHDSTVGWVLWAIGIFITIFFEQMSNFHFVKFSKIANQRDVSNVKHNIMANKVLRTIAFFGWLFSFFALAIISISSDGTFSSIW